MMILCLHDVVTTDPSSPWTVTEQEIEDILTRFRGEGYSLAKLDDLHHAPTRSVSVTVDDGRSGALSWLERTAPTLGVTATLFLVTRWLDDPAHVPAREVYSEFGTWEQVARLHEAGHQLGSHSHTHVRLAGLRENEIKYELTWSKARIEQQTGVHPKHFAAPYGSISPLSIREAWAAGYETVASTVPGVNGDLERQTRVLKRTVLRRDWPHLGLLSEEVDV